MAESAHPQGWQVPQRTPVLVAVAVLALLLALLGVAGWVYRSTLAPQHTQPMHSFPAPGVESFVHDGVEDPHTPSSPPRRDPAIEAAKRDIVAHGIAGWPQ